MIYYLDGYNLLLSLGESEPNYSNPLSSQTFHDLIEINQTINLSLIIVFDAYNSPKTVSRLDFKRLEVVYTDQGQTADDYICEAIEVSLNPQNCTVVTNDGQLKKKANLLTGKSLNWKQFFSLIKRKSNTKLNSVNKKQGGNLKHYNKHYEEIFLKKLKDLE